MGFHGLRYSCFSLPGDSGAKKRSGSKSDKREVRGGLNTNAALTLCLEKRRVQLEKWSGESRFSSLEQSSGWDGVRAATWH